MGRHKYAREDEDDVFVVSYWVWIGGGLTCLLLLATLAVSSGTLGIVNENKNKWKGHDSNSDAILNLLNEKFHGVDEKIQWIKKQLHELDDIDEGVHWIGKHLGSDKEYEQWKKRKTAVCPVPDGYQLLFCDPYDGTQGIYDPSLGCSYFFFADPTVPFVGNDGVATQNFKDDFISVSSIPFKQSLPKSPAGASGHVHWLNYQTIPKVVGPHEVLRYDIKMSCVTEIGDVPFSKSFITDPYRDIRIASCAQNTIDFDTAMVFDWFKTAPKNGRPGVKGCFYERLPFLRNCTNQDQPECYRAFSSFNVTGVSFKDDVDKFSIEYDRKEGKARWYDDGKLVCETGKLGTPNPGFVLRLDHGGNNKIVDMEQLSLGFGTFDLLDMGDFLNPNSQDGLVMLSNLTNFYVFPCETCFADVESKEENRLFGQGAEISVFQSQASIRSDDYGYDYKPKYYNNSEHNMVRMEYTGVYRAAVAA